MSKKKSELATSTGKEVAAPSLDAWGPAPELDQDDVKVPQILTVQGTSKSFNGKNLCHLVNSVTGETLGTPDTPLEVIPVHATKNWQVFDCSGNEPKFVRVEPITRDNTRAAWEFEEDGKPMRRDRNLMFYVLLAKDVANGSGMPYVLSFKRTSINGGKKLNTLMYVANAAAKLAPAGTVVNVVTRKVEKYSVTDVEPVRASTDAEVAEAFKWFQVVNAGGIEVDHSNVTDVPASSNGFTNDDIPF